MCVFVSPTFPSCRLNCSRVNNTRFMDVGLMAMFGAFVFGHLVPGTIVMTRSFRASHS